MVGTLAAGAGCVFCAMTVGDSAKRPIPSKVTSIQPHIFDVTERMLAAMICNLVRRIEHL